MLYTIVLICAGNLLPRDCDKSTARAYRSSVEPGIVCGLPSSNHFADNQLAPSENEYIVTRCKIGR